MAERRWYLAVELDGTAAKVFNERPMGLKGTWDLVPVVPASESLAQIDPPTDNQRRMAEAVMNPLTDTQRMAVYAVVLHEAGLEVRDEQ